MTDSGADRLSDRRPPQPPDPEREPVEPPRFPEPRSLMPGAERRVEVWPPPVDRQTRTLEVSDVLPEAIANSAGDPQLARALVPAIEQALSASARRDPRPLADALMPVVGRALRKSIAQTLAPLITLGAAAMLVAGVWIFQGFRERQVWNAYVERLGAEPGIVVIQSGRQDGKYVVRGLRDELAVDPATLLAASGLPPDSVEGRWEPYYALHPRFVSERARLVLRPPAGVTLTYRDGVLTARGTAPESWVADSRDRAPALAGVRRFEFVGDAIDSEEATGAAAAPPSSPPAAAPSAPVPSPSAPPPAAPPAKTPDLPARPAETEAATPTPPALAATPSERRLIEQIEVSSLEFSPLRADLVPGQEASIRRLSTLFRELNEIVHARGARASVDIVAFAPESAGGTGRSLARARANAVLALIRRDAFDALVLTARTRSIPAADDKAAAETDDGRRVSFRVRLLASRDQ